MNSLIILPTEIKGEYSNIEFKLIIDDNLQTVSFRNFVSKEDTVDPKMKRRQR